MESRHATRGNDVAGAVVEEAEGAPCAPCGATRGDRARMKKKLMLLDEFEQELVRNSRERRANLKELSDLFERGRARVQARFEAPPVGGAYHCKECGHGTDCSDRVCLPCAIL